ncbi:hypothetical protein BDV95DRAFT_500321 [Massariosphaeria phaeospora]|uniref:Ysc84 actin-binding domain-containing protein n=1 Tax=Massariosphaeria phaeospora TaxID=100035 RepID=A0A7C8M4Y9_9PLEO|nr:hypothetical protein BDV95DRAFT_500321 [Massariosphaeria phaeospora]
MAFWQKTKTGGKVGFEKVYGWVDKLGPPVNRLSNKLGSEAFWPTTLDKESDKAARILMSFCSEHHDGFYQEEERPSTDGPNTKQKVVKKIPAEVIKAAKGLAIFTTMRTGLWVSGAGGSGVLVGRLEDGSWSPPSGIMLHTAGLGFLAGIDIYDCVVVINTQKALDAFSTVRCTLGGEISAVAGPVGVGGLLETELHKRQAPVFTYLKSRGFYAGIQADGTIIIERTDENERFYGERIGVADILAGKARHPPYEIKKLMATIKAAQGDTDVDASLLPSEPPPGDYEIENEDKTFGVPAQEDPDPFGVLALQNAGLDIREAGTHIRPTSEQFEFKPSPTSPIYGTFRKSFDRSSIDGASRRSSWRTSNISSMLEPKSSMVDMCTQTDFDAPDPLYVPPQLPPQLPPRHEARTPSPVLAEIPEMHSTDDVHDTTPNTKRHNDNDSRPNSLARKSKALSIVDFDDIDDEEPVIQEIQQAVAPQVITRARIVTVAKPIPPKLPPRNPFRSRLSVNSDIPNEISSRDASAGPSPMVAHGQSPPPTPSLKNDGSSASSQDSILSVEDSLDHVSDNLQPQISNTEEKKEDKDSFHSVPASPIQNIPGGFI